MRILHIHPSMKGGEIEAMICGLANEMVKTEDVTVCSIFKSKENDVFWKKMSPHVKRVHLGKSKPGFSYLQFPFLFILQFLRLLDKC